MYCCTDPEGVTLEVCLGCTRDSKGKAYLTPKEQGTWTSMSLPNGIFLVSNTRDMLHQRARELGAKLPPPSRIKPANIQKFILNEKYDLKHYETALAAGLCATEDLLYFLECEASMLVLSCLRAGKELAYLGLTKSGLLLDHHAPQASRAGYVYRIEGGVGLDEVLEEGFDPEEPPRYQSSDIDWEEFLAYLEDAPDTPETPPPPSPDRFEDCVADMRGLTLRESRRAVEIDKGKGVACACECKCCGAPGQVLLRDNGYYEGTCDVCGEDIA